MPGFSLFLRSRHTALLGALTVLICLVSSTVPASLNESPLTAEWRSVPLLSATVLPGIAWATTTVSPGHSLEASLPGVRVRAYRLALFLTALLVFSAAGTAVLQLQDWWHMPPSAFTAGALCRNIAFSMGAGAVSAAVLNRELAWMPLACYGALNWTMGTSDREGTAHAWAVLNADSSSGTAMILSLLVASAGMVAYAIWDGRGNR